MNFIRLFVVEENFKINYEKLIDEFSSFEKGGNNYFRFYCGASRTDSNRGPIDYKSIALPR